MINIVRLTKRTSPKQDSLQEVVSNEVTQFTFIWNSKKTYTVNILQSKSTSTNKKDFWKFCYKWNILWENMWESFSKNDLYSELSTELLNLGFKSKDSEDLVLEEQSFDIEEELDSNEEDLEWNEEDSKLSDEIQDLVYESQISELTELLKKDKKSFDKLNNLDSREYQKEAITTTVKNLTERKDKLWVWKWLLVLPTWFWKTYISAKIASELEKLHTDKKKPFRVLFLVHKNDIVSQTATIMKNGVKWPFTNFFWYNKVWMLVGWKKKYHKAINNVFTWEENSVLVANINTLVWMLSKFPKDYFDVIIADECHRSIWATYKQCIEYFDYKYLLGVTATPSRVWKKAGLTTDSLFNFFENNVIYQRELEDAIKQNILAKPLYFVRVKENDLTKLEDDVKKQMLYKTNFHWHTKSKKKYLDNFDIFDSDVDFLYQNNKKTVVFCESIDIAEEVFNKINNKWYPTIRMYFRPDRFNKDWKQISHRTWESKITPDRFMNLIEQFKSMTSWFLVVVDLFIEWTDIPEIDAMMLLRPTSSERIYFQILWRWLRRTETKDSCLVFDYNFETIRLDLLKKKISLFNLIRKDINTPSFSKQYQVASKYIDELDKVMSQFELDEEEQERFKAKHKSTLFRDLVIPEVIDDLFSITQDERLSNREKINLLRDYKYSIPTVWKKNFFDDWLDRESTTYFEKLLDIYDKSEFEDFLLDSETTLTNKVIPRISNSTKNTDWLTDNQKKKLDEFLEKNSNIGLNYTLEQRVFWNKTLLYVKYDKWGSTTYFPLDDFKKL